MPGPLRMAIRLPSSATKKKRALLLPQSTPIKSGEAVIACYDPCLTVGTPNALWIKNALVGAPYPVSFVIIISIALKQRNIGFG
jgi:hypothetical protein